MSDGPTSRLNIRTHKPSVRAKVLSSVKRIVKAECAASGAPDAEIAHTTSVPALVNNAEMTEKLLGAFSHHFSSDN